MIEGKLFITGGAGTLGKAVIRRANQEGWPCDITVFSRDPMKQIALKKEYPSVNFILGDVTDFQSLKLAMAGHDVVLHLAAQKHIPVGEFNVMMTINVNLVGSINVAQACVENMVKKCVGISTDKVVHAVNTYGATKYLMEKVFQEYAVTQNVTKFNLVRYGNVLGSEGSVIQVWRNMEAEGKRGCVTDPGMSRFWLTVDGAVDVILMALQDPIPSGTIVIPKCLATTMGALAQYTLKNDPECIGIRPGEKRHEELLGKEESRYASESKVEDWIFLAPTTTEPLDGEEWSYDSESCFHHTKEEILKMIGE